MSRKNKDRLVLGVISNASASDHPEKTEVATTQLEDVVTQGVETTTDLAEDNIKEQIATNQEVVIKESHVTKEEPAAMIASEKLHLVDNDIVLSEECAYKIVNHIGSNEELLKIMSRYLADSLIQRFSDAEKMKFINNSVYKDEINLKLVSLKQGLNEHIKKLTAALQLIPIKVADETLTNLTN